MNGACEYTAQKGDPENWHGESPQDWVLDRAPKNGGLGTDNWECPHPALDAGGDQEQYCVFHTDPEDLPDDIDEGEAIKKAIEQADGDGLGSEHRAQFVGATFGAFDLSGVSLSTGHVQDIRFDHALFRNETDKISFADATLKVGGDQEIISFAGAGLRPVENEVTFEDAEFAPGGGTVSFANADIVPEAHAESPGGVVFRGIECAPSDGGSVVFDAKFDTVGTAEISFESATFRPNAATVRFGGEFVPDSSPVVPDEVPVKFDDAEFVPEFNGTVEFVSADFRPRGRSGISFQEARFDVEEGRIVFDDTTFAPEEHAEITFKETQFGAVKFDATLHPIDRGTVSFETAEFEATAIAEDIVLGGKWKPEDNGRILFTDASFQSGASFADVRFQAECCPADDSVISFENATYEPENVGVERGSRDDDSLLALVSFSDAEFRPKGNGTVSFRDGVFTPGDDAGVLFDNAEFRPKDAGRVLFTDSDFSPDKNGEIRFEDVPFVLEDQTCVSFTDAEFYPAEDGSVSFRGAELTTADESTITFSDSTFEPREDATISFDDTTVVADDAGTVSFEDATFRNDFSFKFETCKGNVSFDEITASGTVTFPREAAPGADVSFSGADFSAARLVDFDPVPGMDFSQADFTDTDLSNVTFRGSDVQQAIFSRADLYGVDFTGAKIDGTLFGDALVNHETDFGHQPDGADDPGQFDNNRNHVLRVAYDHEPAPKRGVLARVRRAVRRYRFSRLQWDREPLYKRLDGDGTNSDGRGLCRSRADRGTAGGTGDGDDTDGEPQSGDADDTYTDGSPTNDHQADRSPSRTAAWIDQMQTAAGSYQIIESVARENALSDLQSKAFLRRQEMNRQRYAAEAKRLMTDDTEEVSARRGSLGWLRKWFRASIARLSLMYGESFGRIIKVSFLVIFAIAFTYPIGGWFRPREGERIFYTDVLSEPSLFLESFYFSTLTFTTLGMGDYEPVGFGQVLATLNTALGAIMIALLVFVLGRRAAR